MSRQKWLFLITKVFGEKFKLNDFSIFQNEVKIRFIISDFVHYLTLLVNKKTNYT